ncbi:MAG: trimeric autotransporter adhesin, partial [Acidimicrobiaceae bacterium]
SKKRRRPGTVGIVRFGAAQQLPTTGRLVTQAGGSIDLNGHDQSVQELALSPASGPTVAMHGATLDLHPGGLPNQIYADFGRSVLDGDVHFSSPTSAIDGPGTLAFTGRVSGNPGVTVRANAAVEFTPSSVVAVDGLQFAQGRVDGEVLTAPINGGRLSGSGTVQDVTMAGQSTSVMPGSLFQGPVTLTARNVTLKAASSLAIMMNDYERHCGTCANQLHVLNRLDLSEQPDLTIDDATPTEPGRTFTVVRLDSLLPIAGTFHNLPEGSTALGQARRYRISYRGGDGNDITLTDLGPL